MIALWIRLVFLRNVSIHVSASNVETGLSVRWITIRPIVFVLLGSRETLPWVALMLSADMMKIVGLTRSVMPVSRNASKYVRETLVAHQMQSVRLRITGSAAIALPLSLAMAMFTAA